MMTTVSARSLGEIAALVARAYPHESCGWVRSSGGVEPVVNTARDPRRAYAFSFAENLRFEAAFLTADPPVAVYHSHPDGPATLSAADLEHALFEGAPLHPVRQIVVGVSAGQPRRITEYAFAADGYAVCQTVSLPIPPQEQGS